MINCRDCVSEQLFFSIFMWIYLKNTSEVELWTLLLNVYYSGGETSKTHYVILFCVFLKPSEERNNKTRETLNGIMMIIAWRVQRRRRLKSLSDKNKMTFFMVTGGPFYPDDVCCAQNFFSPAFFTPFKENKIQLFDFPSAKGQTFI